MQGLQRDGTKPTRATFTGTMHPSHRTHAGRFPGAGWSMSMPCRTSIASRTSRGESRFAPERTRFSVEALATATRRSTMPAWMPSSFSASAVISPSSLPVPP